MEEILFSIIAGIFAILASVFGVRNRINGTRTRTNGRVCDDGGGCNDIVSDNKRLKRNKDRISELDKRDADKLKECSRIGKRIRKREQKADISE